MSEQTLDALILSRLGRVFGDVRAREIRDSILAETGLATVSTWVDLVAFGSALERRAGLEGTMGAVLKVDATLHRYGKLQRGG